jgi:hypothetical protein
MSSVHRVTGNGLCTAQSGAELHRNLGPALISATPVAAPPCGLMLPVHVLKMVEGVEGSHSNHEREVGV